MSNEPQTLQNHGRIVPGYHYVTALVGLAALVTAVVVLVREPSLTSATLVLLAVSVWLVAYYARVFPLGTQNRIIRLEERLRLERLLPDDLKPRVMELTTGQLIALRFASDGEVAELMRRVLGEGITERKAIKALVREWRADYERI